MQNEIPAPLPTCPESMELAQAYVPMQTFGDLFTPEEALRNGTLFPCLYRPFVPYHQRTPQGGAA